MRSYYNKKKSIKRLPVYIKFEKMPGNMSDMNGGATALNCAV